MEKAPKKVILDGKSYKVELFDKISDNVLVCIIEGPRSGTYFFRVCGDYADIYRKSGLEPRETRVKVKEWEFVY